MATQAKSKTKGADPTSEVPMRRDGGRRVVLTTDRPNRYRIRIESVIILILVSFYGGLLAGWSSCVQCGNEGNKEGAEAPRCDEEWLKEIVRHKVEIELVRREYAETANAVNESSQKQPRMGSGTSKFAFGTIRTSREEILQQYDHGMAKKLGHEAGTEEALILYNKLDALPTKPGVAEAAAYEGTGQKSTVPFLNADDATSNCDFLRFVMVNTDPQSRQCLAIVGTYESYHVHKWMRLSEKRNGIDQSAPLVHVGRGVGNNGYDDFRPPSKHHIQRHRDVVQKYLNSISSVQTKLALLLRDIPKEAAIITMVCNQGQSDLLINFACAAKSRNMDISKILVFATDEYTLAIVQNLGMKGFYDEGLFGHLPSKEAKLYGDNVFSAMMFAKVVSVSLLVELGYDVLYQDVDIVWYKNPLVTFRDESSPLYDFDVLFQEDGARSLRYAPYSSNSGFYYVRNNERTRYLFHIMVYYGDSIAAYGSHQQVLTALISEHSSLHGLKVKTLPTDDFPGGFHFHRRHDLMRSIMKGDTVPWIFHMSWTANKENKLKFFKQMGLWFVQPVCEHGNAGGGGGDNQDFVSSCCAKEPLISCFYKDKPSIIPCNDSPDIDGRGRSFWK